jgi:basic membrane protein A and related proteins
MSFSIRRASLTVVGLASVAAIVAGCGSSTSSSDSSTAGSSKAPSSAPKVALIINGNTGDGGFFDQANAGVANTAAKLGMTAKVIETGYTPTKWAPALEDAAAGDYGVVIAGSFAMAELVEQAAAQDPSKKFVLFDVAYDKKKCGGCANIYSIVYRYNETGYLAGVVAGLVTRSKTPRTNAKNVVGFVGGQDIPVIEEYKKGFLEGVKAVDPSATVESAFAGSFSDPVKGKQLASNIIAKGADVVFTAAGDTDKGVIQAAADAGVWALGNSAQQAAKNKVDGKLAVLTSSDTSVESSLEDAMKLIKEGKLPTGTVRSFGAKEGTNKIIDSAPYLQYVPAAIRTKVTDIQKQIVEGSLQVG